MPLSLQSQIEFKSIVRTNERVIIKLTFYPLLI